MPFDAAYYRRYYYDRRTAVTSRVEMRTRARLITSCVAYIGLPVARILDAGCGVGLLRTPLLREFKRASYTGLETSEYLCERYGWVKGTIESFRAPGHYDLVICYDVLQYLSPTAATRAIANLARLCRGALYFGALTREDWSEHCDRRRTHRVAGLRSGGWYRRALARAFRPIGCGMWIKRGAPLTLWNLDAAA